MFKIKGIVRKGVGHFTVRMTAYPELFSKAVGEELAVGTLNVHVGRGVPIRPNYFVDGSKLEEFDQDHLIERCKINGIDAYRVRPYMHLVGGPGFVGMGGHGDFIIEILCSKHLRTELGLSEGDEVELEFERGGVYL